MARPTLRVLCFGDSWTAGYHGCGAAYHPYAEKLAQMISMALPHIDIHAVEDGKPGDMVRGGFYERLKREFKKTATPYDWTIVLGGTNDLAYANVDPEDVYAELKRVWSLALSKNTQVLALTVPQVGVQGFRGHADERRNRLNDLIKSHKEQNFHVFDLHAVLPYFALSAAERARYWDDHVHLTPDGYDLMGTKIGINLVSILVREKAYPNPKQRRGFKDDRLEFEEEVGDAAHLDQGYVVVRWKDLD